MKKFGWVLLLSLPLAALAQKVNVDKKTNMVTVDKVYSFKIDRFDCGIGATNCHFDVSDTSGTKVLRINFREFKSFAERNASNPEGRIVYYEFVFLTSKTKAEINFVGGKEEKVAKAIVKNNLFLNGKLNEKAVEEFVLVNGTPFSVRARQ